MYDLLSPRGLTVFAGHTSQDQSSIACAASFELLLRGVTLVGLVDMPADISTLQVRTRDWLRGAGLEIDHLDRVVGVGNFRQYNNPQALADAITAVLPIETKEIVVLADLARTDIITPNNSIATTLAALPSHITATVVATYQYGPVGMPAPKVHEYPADRIYQVRYGFGPLSVDVTPIKPSGDKLHFMASKINGSAVLIERDENPHVIR